MSKKQTQVADKLLQWYWQEKRDLPWRADRNPYTIWISEIMLQQTRVEAVKPYYYRFVEQFPTIEKLAKASEQVVLKAWEGLGYYSRARNLHKAAKEIVDNHGGQMPTDYKQVKALPGIGDYTAGAIMSIAYNKPYPAVDGNVLRVFSRLYNIHLDIMKANTKKHIEALVQESMPIGYASDFNQALMDVGSSICIPKTPKCECCPVNDCCAGYKKGQQQFLPIKAAKKKPVPVSVASVYIMIENKILIEKRNAQGMLVNMWQFPMEEGRSSSEAWGKLADRLKMQFPDVILTKESLCTQEHIYSHRHWYMSVYKGKEDETNKLVDDLRVREDDTYHWVFAEELETYPLPTIFKKALEKIRNG